MNWMTMVTTTISLSYQHNLVLKTEQYHFLHRKDERGVFSIPPFSLFSLVKSLSDMCSYLKQLIQNYPVIQKIWETQSFLLIWINIYCFAVVMVKDSGLESRYFQLLYTVIFFIKSVFSKSKYMLVNMLVGSMVYQM